MIEEVKQTIKLAKVEKLRKSTSEHDIVYKGKVHRCELLPCNDGVIIRYVTTAKARDKAPSFLAPMIDPTQEVEDVVYETHLHEKWYHRAFHIPLEFRVKRKIKWIKKQVNEKVHKFERVEALKASLGVTH